VCEGCHVPCRRVVWCGSFAVNGKLGTDTVQEIVDALPHACMQRLGIGGAFPASLCLCSTCCPAASAWFVWLVTHTTAAWCHVVVVGLHSLVKPIGVMLLCGDVSHSVGGLRGCVCCVRVLGEACFRHRHHRPAGVSAHLAQVEGVERLRCVWCQGDQCACCAMRNVRVVVTV